ncbi:MAG: polymorphic toxin type 44 domain-containing protein, partial [Aureispira sp.]
GYNYVLGNPLKYIDPDGMRVEDNFVFDENGDFVRIDKNNDPDRLVIESSVNGQREEYEFADPVNDPESIRKGEIDRVVFVQPDVIMEMVNDAGAMNEENRASPISYIKKAGLGGQAFDFSYTAIPSVFKADGASEDPLGNPSSLLFLVNYDGATHVHNHMNFGNFLYGAAGMALGISSDVLRLGAHANGLLNSDSNGYSPELDSADDQLSIVKGIKFADRYGLDMMLEKNNNGEYFSGHTVTPKRK